MGGLDPVRLDRVAYDQLVRDAVSWRLTQQTRDTFDRLRRPPEYGSDEYEQLPHDSPLRIEALYAAADKWRRLAESPHVADLLHEWAEWDRRRELSEATAAMSRMHDWRLRANAPTYAELERRRNTYTTEPLTADEIRAHAAASWAGDEQAHQAREDQAA